MQTFVPYGPHFTQTAMCLDRQRLGKQRVEAFQILKTIRGESKGWANHPAVKMWVGYESALRLYGAIMCVEWKRRGYTDNLLHRFDIATLPSGATMPSWLYDESVQLSHQSNLLRKFPEHYGQYWPDVRDDLPYVWPTSATNTTLETTP